jgi:hypothetical protein
LVVATPQKSPELVSANPRRTGSAPIGLNEDCASPTSPRLDGREFERSTLAVNLLSGDTRPVE